MRLLVTGVTRIVERIYVITCIRPGRYKLFPQLVISFSFITLLDFALNILWRAARGAPNSNFQFVITHFHGKTGNSCWKINWFAPFRLGSFRKHGLCFLGNVIFLLFLVYSTDLDTDFVAGFSPTTSIFSVLCLCTRF